MWRYDLMAGRTRRESCVDMGQDIMKSLIIDMNRVEVCSAAFSLLSVTTTILISSSSMLLPRKLFSHFLP